jgi:hypothetical protein
MKIVKLILKKTVYFLFILLITIFFSGCYKINTNKKESNFVLIQGQNPLKIVEIDSCEYLLGEWGNATVLTHKGNCKFCAERNKNNTNEH